MSLLERANQKLMEISVKADKAQMEATPASVKRTRLIGTALLVSSMAAMPAMAGTGGDALLKDTFDSSMGVIQGYGAKLATGVSGAFAMIGSIFKFQPQLIASTLGVGFTGASVDNAIDFTVTGLLM
ncbi:hypothetical protein [Vibrio mediterranei]|uniref:Conjugal transfer protein TraA n=1 Tax=Vibrio mediterranei TaxID=689 RepID=A0ABX5D654_9VIBR|nr:hypothetical protein [Vibrio mediterranei]MCG9658654.1 hypothetical protein [Vibrio mediterranei]PRQ65169.1 hypothetical protein COR51_23905 [Vibrio mediterranei]